VRLSGGIGTHALDLNGAIALPGHVGLMTNVSFGRDLEDAHNHLYADVGGGWYFAHGQLLVEAFAGFGVGAAEAHGTAWTPLFSTTRYDAKATYKRAFGQLGCAFGNERVEAGGALRAARLWFHLSSGTKDWTETDLGTQEFTEDLQNRQNYLALEPVVFLRIGGRRLKFQAQLGAIASFGGRPDPKPWPLHFSLGAIAYFGGAGSSDAAEDEGRRTAEPGNPDAQVGRDR
jgi:hypothetical protein